ncbi:MAG: ABC transporter permease [Erysipelotrichaceae bacterium]|nr:ABC transporter permease [Erysipelotrichaceae bacterium]
MKKTNPFKASLVAVVLGILIGFFAVWITGRNPYNMFVALFRSMTGFNLAKPGSQPNIMFVLNWFLETLPIILTGLSVAFAFRTGLFNIGGEGQYFVGSTAAAFVALAIKLPPIIHPIVSLLAGMLAGAIWGFLPGFLKAYRKVNEVVICIMLNYVGWYFSAWFVRSFLPIDPNTNARTIDFQKTAIFGTLGFGTSSQFNWSFIVVIICLIIYHILIEKTTFGYSLRATGFNSEAARYAGMKTKRNIVYSMMISGAFSGAAGAITILGVYKYGRIFTGFDNYGFDGISVALVGAVNSVGIIFSGLLFGLLKACSNNLQLFNIPKEISEIIQSIIIFIVAIQYIITWYENKVAMKKKEVLTDGNN